MTGIWPHQRCVFIDCCVVHAIIIFIHVNMRNRFNLDSNQGYILTTECQHICYVEDALGLLAWRGVLCSDKCF